MLNVNVAAAVPAVDCVLSMTTVSSPVHVGHDTPRRLVKPVPASIVMGPTATLTAPTIKSVVPSVGHGAVYGATVASAPSGTPSTANWTPATPTSSLALARSVVVP